MITWPSDASLPATSATHRPSTRGGSTQSLSGAAAAAMPSANYLHEIIASDDHTTLAEMLQKEALSKACDPAGRPLVFLAASLSRDNCLRTLLNADAPLASFEGATPLHAALMASAHDEPAESEEDERAQRCLALLLGHAEGEALVNTRDAQGRTPTFEAARAGDAKALALILQVDSCDVNLVNAQSGMTPLFRACEEGHVDCVRQLVAAKANVDATEPTGGRSPVFVCAQCEHVDCLEALIDAASPNLRHPNFNGRSPLAIARALQHASCASVLALATLDYDAREFDAVPERQDGFVLKGPPPLATLTTDTRELKATVGGVSRLTVSLPYAFVRRPLDTCHGVVAIVRAYRREQEMVVKVDERAAEGMLEAAFTVQQVLIAMLETLNEVEFATLFLPPDGSTLLLESAVIVGCKMLLAYPRLQTLLQERWAIAVPADVHAYAAKQWWGQSSPGWVEAPADGGSEPAKSRVRLAAHAPPGFARLYARLAWRFLVNVLYLLGGACYPPLEAHLIQDQNARRVAARRRVHARNPRPRQYDAQGTGHRSERERRAKVYLLDGVIVSTALQSRTTAEQEAKRRRWEHKRAALAEEEARLEVFDWPLLQPHGNFLLHAASKITFALIVSLLPPVGESHTITLTVLFTCGLQFLGVELHALVMKPGLWAADVFNGLELISGVGITTGLAMRLFLEGPGRLWQTGVTEAQVGVAHVAQAVLAIGVGAEWIAQWCRLLQASATFGPLVLMALEMIKDCARFLLLLSGVFLSFAVALVILLKPVFVVGEGVSRTVTQVAGDCGYLVADGSLGDRVDGDLTHEVGLGAVWRVSIALLLLVLGEDVELSRCTEGYAVAPMVMGLFRALVLLMALNMLIAQMSTTYERIRERLATNFMFLTALVIVSAMNESDVPAPLRVLSLPYHAARTASCVVEAAAAALRKLLVLGGSPAWQVLPESQALPEASSVPARGATPAGEDDDDDAEEEAEAKPPSATGGGTSFPSSPFVRGSVANMRTEDMVSAEEVKLRATVVAYLEDSAAELGAQDERWKARQSRQIGHLAAAVSDVRRTLTELGEGEARGAQRSSEELHRVHEELMEQRQLLADVAARLAPHKAPTGKSKGRTQAAAAEAPGAPPPSRSAGGAESLAQTAQPGVQTTRPGILSTRSKGQAARAAV